MSTFELLESELSLTVSLLSDLPGSTDPSTWPYLTVPNYLPQQTLPIIQVRLADQLIGFMTAMFPQIGQYADQVKAVGVTYLGQYVMFMPAPGKLLANRDLPISISYCCQKWTAP